jgi:hypothetical protein
LHLSTNCYSIYKLVLSISIRAVSYSIYWGWKTVLLAKFQYITLNWNSYLLRMRDDRQFNLHKLLISTKRKTTQSYILTLTSGCSFKSWPWYQVLNRFTNLIWLRRHKRNLNPLGWFLFMWMNSQFSSAEKNIACMRTKCVLVKRQVQPVVVDHHFRSATEISSVSYMKYR